MVVPHVLARVKEARQQTGRRIKPRDIRSLVEIVVQARQRQIFRNGCSVVLLSDHTVDLERENVELLREPAVFARVGGALPDQSFQRLVHDLTRPGS